jgi:hypothetical protein
MHRPDVRVILFDLGGVLVQLSGVATILDWIEHTIPAVELWRLWLRSPSVRAFETGQLEPREFAAHVLAELNINDMEPKRFSRLVHRWPSGLYPGALEMIASIPRRYTRRKRYRHACSSRPRAGEARRVLQEAGVI